MEKLSTFEIHIKGHRDGHQLTPGDFDVDEWIAALKHGKHLLYPESTSKKRPKITVEQKEGSIRLLLLTATALVVQANALLAKVDQTKELGILPMRQAEAVRFFHKMAKDNQFDISFGEAGTVNRTLHLHKNLEFQPEEPAWVTVEAHVWGKILDMGGKTVTNIHLDSEAYGPLTISATENQLASEEKNRLYQRHQLHVRLRQNAYTGEYDTKYAKFLGFIDYPEESVDEYLDRLIRQATPNLSKIKDKDSWLRDMRGYED